MWVKNVSSVLICLLWSLCAYCQVGRFFSSEQLSSSMISTACIAQDSEGFIWIGTEYGLNRYDGYHFNCFLNDAKDTKSLGYNLVSTLLCEKSGQIFEMKKPQRTYSPGLSFKKDGGFLLSRIALQYHRRRRA